MFDLKLHHEFKQYKLDNPKIIYHKEVKIKLIVRWWSDLTLFKEDSEVSIMPPSPNPLFTLYFIYPPNKHLLPKEVWEKLKKAILTKTKYCLILHNYFGVTLIQAVPEGVIFRTLYDFYPRDDQNEDLSKYGGSHFFLPLYNDDLRKNFANYLDQIKELCSHVE